jgi:hypothetical protein
MGPDNDGDRVPDAVDNCVGKFNPDQYDTELGSAGGDACDKTILSESDEPIAVVRFAVVDQFGNNLWDFGVTGTVTRYFPEGPTEGPLGELAFGRGAAQLYLPIMWSACGDGPPWCPIPTTVAYGLNPIAGCDTSGAGGEIEAKGGEIRYVTMQISCTGVRVALVDENFAPIPGGCFGAQVGSGITVASACDTEGDGIVEISGLENGAYRVYLAESGQLFNGTTYDGYYGRGVDRALCDGWEQLLIVDGGSGMYHVTMQILCGDSRTNPSHGIRCAGSDCYMIWSQEMTANVAAQDPSRLDAIRDLTTNLACDTVGGITGKLSKRFGGVFSTVTSWACGGAATYVVDGELNAEDAAMSLGQGSACTLAGEFTKGTIGSICSVGLWMGTNWLDWMKQSEIIDAGIMGGCYAIPVNQYTHEPEYGWHQQEGFPLISTDPWCYSESGPYIDDWD